MACFLGLPRPRRTGSAGKSAGTSSIIVSSSIPISSAAVGIPIVPLVPSATSGVSLGGSNSSDL